MKNRRSKQARIREFNKAARMNISIRDHGACIFCEKGYHIEDATWYSTQLKSIMHYIPRSQNGLGIEENGAVGCEYHHVMMDNGNSGRREEMLEIFREYLKSNYENWNESKLVYCKWDF